MRHATVTPKCFPFEGAKRGTVVNECPVGIQSRA